MGFNRSAAANIMGGRHRNRGLRKAAYLMAQTLLTPC